MFLLTLERHPGTVPPAHADRAAATSLKHSLTAWNVPRLLGVWIANVVVFLGVVTGTLIATYGALILARGRNFGALRSSSPCGERSPAHAESFPSLPIDRRAPPVTAHTLRGPLTLRPAVSL